jgi:cell wall-associated NlpC family hydrolase
MCVEQRGAIISFRPRQASTLLVILAAAVFLLVGSASADPTQIQSKKQQAQDVLAQIQLIDGQLEQAVERYNLANLRLGRIEADLRSNGRQLVVARTSLKNANIHLSKRLVSIYTSGGSASAMEVLLGAESLSDVVDRLETIERVGSQDNRVVRDVRRFRAEVKARKIRLERAHAEQRRVVVARADERRSIEGQLASRQQMLSSIQSEIEQLQAAEQRRQERLAAEARARLAQQRIAPSQAQSRPPAAVSDNVSSVPDVGASIPAAPDSRYGGVIGIAMQYLGVPYRWGGADPSGFDCSGFIMYVYSQMGVSLPHHAASQYGIGVPVSRDQLQAGDLVFFNGLGHAGIYVGGDAFIHAPHTGDVVKISSLSDSWYAATWVGARRIL